VVAGIIASVRLAPISFTAMRAPPTGPSVDVRDPRVVEAIDRYWRRNVRIMAVLLAIWAAAGLGCGVLFADFFNQFRLGGFPLGFWFAQQGSILIFVLLILAYGLLLNRLDDAHHLELERLRAETPPAAEP
jgi:putative solute:sodium symporter small subunit